MILFMKNGKAKTSNSISKIEKNKENIGFLLYPLTRDFDKFFLLMSPDALTRKYKSFKLKYSISLFSGDVGNAYSDQSDELPISRYGIFMKDVTVKTENIDIFLNALCLLFSVNSINDIINNPFESGTFYILFAIHDIKIECEMMNGEKHKFKSSKLKPYSNSSFNCEVYDFEELTTPYTELYKWMSSFFEWDRIYSEYGFESSLVLSIKGKGEWEAQQYHGFLSSMNNFLEYSYNYFDITQGIFHEVNGACIPDLINNMPKSLDIIVFDHSDAELNFNDKNVTTILPEILEDDMGDLWHLRDYIENISEKFFIIFNITYDLFTEYMKFAQLLLVSKFLTMFLEYAVRTLYVAVDPNTLFTLTCKRQMTYESVEEDAKNRAANKNRIVPNSMQVTSSHQIEFLLMDSKYINMSNFILGCRSGDIVYSNLLEVYSY